MSKEENKVSSPSVQTVQNPSKVLNSANYVSKIVGFPVEPGQDWRHLTPEQRNQWFRQHENKWKTRFGATNRGVEANMNWTRG
jgi:hypothetical protein